MPNITRGGDMKGLLRYLVGPGRANEHERPHVVASDGYASLMHDGDELDASDAAEIAEHIDAPRQLYGTSVRAQVTEQDPETGEKRVTGYRDAHVWHCSLSISADEGRLSDDQWRAFATDFMDRMGFTETGAGEGKAPCRWAAIHHGLSKSGNDHVHVVASLVREDGTKWEGRMGAFERAQEVCRELETKYGLAHPPGYEAAQEIRATAGRDVAGAGRGAQLAVRGEKPAEQRQAAAVDLPATAPKVMAERLRAAAVASSSEAEWIRRARAEGVVLKPYYAKSARGTDAGAGARSGPGSGAVVTGYRAALRPESYNDKLVFYGGGRLGKDLALPRLRERWSAPDEQESAAAIAEWNAAFEGRAPVGQGRESAGLDRFRPDAQTRASQRLGELNEQLRQVPIGDHAAWADAARDASGVLSAWARFDQANAAEFRAAAHELSRSAQLTRRSQPHGARVKDGAMGAALILSAAARPGTEPQKAKVVAAVLLRQLVKTAEAVRDQHQAAGRLHHARAVQAEVVDRLQRVSLAGYQTEATTPAATPAATPQVRPESALTTPGRGDEPEGRQPDSEPGDDPGRRQGPRRAGRRGRRGVNGPQREQGDGERER